METKHTPGPWKATNLPGHSVEIHARIKRPHDVDGTELLPIYTVPIKPSFQIGDDGILYARLSYDTYVQFPDHDWKDTQFANAKLIAASPMLLKELEATANALESLVRSLPTCPGGENIKIKQVVNARAAIAKATE